MLLVKSMSIEPGIMMLPIESVTCGSVMELFGFVSYLESEVVKPNIE